MYISDLFTYNTIFVGNQTFECIIVSFGFLSCKFCVCLLYRPPSSQGVLVASFPGPAQLSVAFSTVKRGEPGIFSHVSMT